MNKKQNIYNYIIILILITYNYVYYFAVLKLFRNEESLITSAFLILLFIAVVMMFGFSKSILNPNKKKATKRVGIIVILAIAVTYCLGAFVGFLKNRLFTFTRKHNKKHICTSFYSSVYRAF